MPKREPRAASSRPAEAGNAPAGNAPAGNAPAGNAPAGDTPASDAPERASGPYPGVRKAARPARVREAATYNLYEAKTQLSELVERAARGEEIVIAKAGTPMARLAPLPAGPPLRVPGLLKGKIWVADDFDDPLPPEVQQYFDDPQIFPPDDDERGPR